MLTLLAVASSSSVSKGMFGMRQNVNQEIFSHKKEVQVRK